MTVAVWELTTGGADGVMWSLTFVYKGVAVGVTSSIVSPYKRDDTINAAATVENGEAVFTHGSPRSSAPGTVHGTPAAIGSASPAVPVTELRTGSQERTAGARPRPAAGY